MVNHLVGFGVGGGGLTTLAQVGSAVSTLATITAPATINPGDLLVLWQRAVNITTTIPTLVEPSGFTTISNTSFVSGGANGARYNVCYKIADGSEDGAALTGMDGSAADAKALYQFRGDVPISGVTVGDLETQSTDGNPSSQTVGASGGVAPLIVLAGYDTSGTTDPRTFTVAGVGAKDGEINAGAGLYLAFKIYNNGPQDVVVDMADEGNGNTLHTFYLQCS
jgi:hypothetical protein